MAYAVVADVQARMRNTMSEADQTICSNLLDDAAVIIDAYNSAATADAKKFVSVRMVLRALQADEDIPVGATQGSMSALGYSQSWTMGSNTAAGELYLAKIDKKVLGVGNSIGASNPLSVLVPDSEGEG